MSDDFSVLKWRSASDLRKQLCRKLFVNETISGKERSRCLQSTDFAAIERFAIHAKEIWSF